MNVLLLGSLVPAALSADELQHHGAATFLLDGISRAASHQLVRHRLASFSQESQRYVDLGKIAQSGVEMTVIPPAIAQNPEARARFEQAMRDLEQAYGELRALGIRKEDSRFLLPNAAITRIVVTMDFGAWRHFCWLRCDKAAQWEIRAMGQEVLKMLYAIAPDVFAEHWRVYEEQFGGGARGEGRGAA